MCLQFPVWPRFRCSLRTSPVSPNIGRQTNLFLEMQMPEENRGECFRRLAKLMDRVMGLIMYMGRSS